MFRRFLLPLSAFLLTLSVPAFSAPTNFTQAKREAQKIYQSHMKSFYCGCDIDLQEKKLAPDLQ